MITASVGFQCPECAKAGAKQSRTIRYSPGTGAAGVPVVTYALIAINVAVYLIGVAASSGTSVMDLAGSFDAKYSLFTPYVGNGQWYRIVTGGFMHAGILHLAMNMWALYILGPQLEALLGRARYLLIYAASLLGGGLGVVLLYSQGQGATVGASGAIFGLLGAFVAVHLAVGQNPLRTGIGQLIGLNLLITFLIPGISIGGHIGGLVSGLVVTYVLVAGRPVRDQSHGEQIARGAAVAVLGLAFLGLAIAVAQARWGLA